MEGDRAEVGEVDEAGAEDVDVDVAAVEAVNMAQGQIRALHLQDMLAMGSHLRCDFRQTSWASSLRLSGRW